VSAFTQALSENLANILSWRRQGIFAVWTSAEEFGLCVLSVPVDGIGIDPLGMSGS